MPDRKFETSNDRNVTLLDAKQRLIDLMSLNQPLPDTGIYDEPVRYFKANLKWTPIIFGWLDFLQDVAGWQEAEDDNYPGIQQLLIFEEGIEPLVTTQEELKEAICEGLTCWSEEMGKRILSGKGLSFSVDADGNIVVGGDTAAEPVPDDPATADINEAKASRYAAALAISKGVNIILADLNTLYGVDVNPDNSVQVALAYMQQYVSSAGMLNALTVYWDARAQGNPQITSVDREDLADYIYCNPFSELYVATTQFIASLSAYTPEQRNNIIGILHELDDTQFNIWYNKGEASLSTEYNNAPCEPVPTQELVTQWGIAGPASSTLKKNHRYLITAEGYLLDPDGSIQDAWYHKEPSSSAVFDDVDFNPQVGGATHVKPSSNEVPYSAAHKYSWTFDMGSINASLQWSIARDATLQASSTSPSGGLKLTIKDLGIII